jgi:hypothetical protein
MWSLLGEAGAVDFDKANVIRAGGETEFTEF